MASIVIFCIFWIPLLIITTPAAFWRVQKTKSTSIWRRWPNTSASRARKIAPMLSILRICSLLFRPIWISRNRISDYTIHPCRFSRDDFFIYQKLMTLEPSGCSAMLTFTASSGKTSSINSGHSMKHKAPL